MYASRQGKESNKIEPWPPPHSCASMIPPGLEDQLAGARYEVFAVGGDANAEWLPDHGTKDFTNAFIADEKSQKVCMLRLYGNGDQLALSAARRRVECQILLGCKKRGFAKGMYVGRCNERCDRSCSFGRVV